MCLRLVNLLRKQVAANCRRMMRIISSAHVKARMKQPLCLLCGILFLIFGSAQTYSEPVRWEFSLRERSGSAGIPFCPMREPRRWCGYPYGSIWMTPWVGSYYGYSGLNFDSFEIERPRTIHIKTEPVPPLPVPTKIHEGAIFHWKK